MADRTRTITLRINDQFSRELNEFVRQMDAATGATERLGRTAAGGGRWGGFKQAAQDLYFMGQSAMMVANQFRGMLSQVNELAQIGIGAERSKMALKALAGGAAEAARWIEAVNAGARGSLTEGEAAAQAYRLMRFGLADSAEEAQRFIDTVSKIAMVNPQLGGTEEAINQIQLTLSNMSFMRLDQLGISAGVVRKRMEELKKTTSELTTEDAFRIAVMEQLSQQADLLGDEFVELDDASKRVGAFFRELREDAGLRVAQALEGIAEGAIGLYDALEKLGAKEFVVRLTVVFGYNMLGDLGKNIAKAADESPEVRRRLGPIQGPAEYGAIEDFINNVPKWLTGLFSKSEIAPMPPPSARQSEIVYPPGQTLEEALANALDDVLWGDVPMSMRPAEQLPMSMAPPGAFIRPSVIPIGGRDAINIIPSVIPIGGRDAIQQPPGALPSWAYMSTPPSGQPLMPIFEPPVQTLGAGLWEQQQLRENRFAMQRIPHLLFGGGHTLGLDYRMGQMAQFTMRDLQQSVPDLLKIRDTVGEIAGKWANVAKAAFEAIQPAERYASLAEKFGIDPHAFDVDVFGHVRDALNDVGVEAELAEKAILAYELATGMATGSSLLFDERLRVLAEALDEGQITADEFARAVMDLGNTDFSWVDSITKAFMDTGGIDAATAYLDRVAEWGKIGSGTRYSAEEANKWLEGVGLAPGQGEAAPSSPLAPLIQDFDALSSRFSNVERDWGEPVITFQNLATGEFDTMAVNAADDITSIEKELDALTQGNFEVKVKIIPSVIPIGGRDAAIGGGTGLSAGDVYDAVVAEQQRRNAASGEWLKGVGLN